ncbi:hypothetical protein [Desulfosporosinus sp. OT]|uniref:hypothetical protein n=1 Tax=Desulfosporosinus sp. OT TaxID=913865 RepID=UPI0002239CF2|nr:hypothetical protein [Desulfosporosinus sp. OT]EGW39357.1 hypothetical protein DOT_2642 [Desulfosporosinus sp. OT]
MDNERFQELDLTKLEDNEKFQQLVAKQFTRINERFEHVDKHLDSIETLLKQNHEDTEKMAIQVEQLVTEHNDLMDYFLKGLESNKNKQTTTI